MKRLVCGVAAVLALAALSAIEVNEGELQATGATAGAVQFENYGGPHSVIESANAIAEIGASLGRAVAAMPDEYAEIQPTGKYTLIHAVGGAGEGRLDADILVLNATAGVDHIRNLRRIIGGYVQTAYGYDAADADAIATFITVYNAVYRSDIAAFARKYKESVVQLLDARTVGLSTRWQDWAGGTQIVIPLGTFRDDGSLSVDTSIISDERVREALRKEEGRAVETREQLTALKEREGADAAQKAKEAQREATEKRSAGDKAGAAEAARTATEQQELADRKRTEVQAEKSDIERDRQALERLPVADERDYITVLFSAHGTDDRFTLVTVDGTHGTVVREAAGGQIRRDVVYAVHGVTVRGADGEERSFDELYLAVCGENSGKSAVRLCLISSAMQEIVKESTETLSERSPLVLIDGGYYVIIAADGGHYVAVYDKSLQLRHRSEVSVSPTTPLNQTPQGLLVSAADGTPHLLNTTDLRTIW